MDGAARYQWLARHVLRHEGEVRAWLLRHVRTLTLADADDLIQEAYARFRALEVESQGDGCDVARA